MPALVERLTEIFSEAFERAGFEKKFGEVVVSQRPELGQFQCNGALAAAGIHKKNPREVAQQVLDLLEPKALFAELSLAGPGFINITVTDEVLAEEVRRMAASDRLGYPEVEQQERVVIDFSGPNAAKEMHVGHLRSTIIGDSIQKIFRFRGDQVISDIHLGDWGLQMGQHIVEIRQRMPDLPYFDRDYSGPYPETSPVTVADLGEIYSTASARSKDDPTFLEAAREATSELQKGRPGYRALWQHIVNVSIAALKRDYEALGGVEFDLWYGESTVKDRIPPMIERLNKEGYTEESRGALVIDVSQEGDKKEMPPLLLVKSGGGYLYGTTDLATIEMRVLDLQADRILYVVDNRQHQHFEQVFRAARKSGIAEDVELEFLGFGTMNGKDGRPFKTRAGGVMRLHDLIRMVTEKAEERLDEIEAAQDFSEQERAEVARQVGLAALKYADLSNHRTSDYIFDLEKFSSFEGRTGPYLLYSAVRIKSILRKAAERGFSPGDLQPPADPAERDLMLALAQLSVALDRTIETRAPNHLCEFAFNLALAFNRFYNACHILSEDDAAQRESWLALSQLCLQAFELITSLLGLEIPERM